MPLVLSRRAQVKNPVFERAEHAVQMAIRLDEKVDVFLCISDKEVTVLSFLNLEGILDYLGFRATYELHTKGQQP